MDADEIIQSLQSGSSATSQSAAPNINYDVIGARAAGVPDSEIADYLAGKSNYDLEGARRAGVPDSEIIDHLAPQSKEVSTRPAPEGPQSSAVGAFGRGLERGALPAAGGMAGFAGGAAAVNAAGLPALAAATGPAAPFVEAGGTLIGGGVGAFGGAALVAKAQQWALDHMPDQFVKALGLDKAQEQADVAEHPYASFAGELAPNLAFMRPGAVAQAVDEGGSAIEKLLASPLTARAVPATIMGAQEAANEKANGGNLDLAKIGIAAGVGAISNRETGLGRIVARAGSAPVDLAVNAARGFRSEAEPTPEADAAPVVAADTVDDAIAAARGVAGQTPVDVAAMAAEAQNTGEAVAAEQEKAAWEPIYNKDDVAIGWYNPDTDERLPLDARPDEATALAPTEQAADINELPPDVAAEIESPEEGGGSETSSRPSGPGPTEPDYTNAKTRAQTYQRWLNELDVKRQQDAAASPQAAFLQQTIDIILKKVNGVEDRLTDAAAARLDAARGTLDDLLHPVGDSPDMAKVRAAMVEQHQKMAEAAAPAPIKQIYAKAQEYGEPITAQDADQILSDMGAHDLDAEGAVLEHIERKAIHDVQSDHGETAAPTEAEAVPEYGGPTEADLGAGPGIEGHIAAAALAGRAGEAGETIAANPGEARPLAEPTPQLDNPASAETPALETRAYLNDVTGEVERREVPTPVPETQEEPAAPEPQPRLKALKPIEGTGEENERAINGATYNVGEEKPQIEAAQKLVDTNYDKAIAVAMRQAQPPAGVHPEFVFMAVEAKATRDGDADLISKLNTSRIAEEATIMGQRIGAWKNRDPLSAVTQVQAVENARAAVLEAREGDVTKAKVKATQEVTDQIQAAKRTAAATRPRPTWEQFISSITCAGE